MKSQSSNYEATSDVTYYFQNKIIRIGLIYGETSGVFLKYQNPNDKIQINIKTQILNKS